MQVYCLSLHASYACRHSGACCSAWEVPAEPHVVRAVRERYGRAADPAFFVASGAGRASRFLIAHAGGACVFRANERCTIHNDAGELALPVSCRHFPRIVLRDARGTLVAFSHYCPTAAALLLASDEPARPIGAAASLAPRDPVEGLDARDALPPLLRPGMLSDIEGYDAWERAVIGVLNATGHAERAVERIEAATDEVRRWTPGNGSLMAAVTFAFASAPRKLSSESARSIPFDAVRALYVGDLPLEPLRGTEGAWDTAVPPDRRDLQRAICNYLAARAFGNWIAYQGLGLRSVAAWLRACYDVLRAIALRDRPASAGPLQPAELLDTFRLADLVMLHTVDSHAFAREMTSLENRRA